MPIDVRARARLTGGGGVQGYSSIEYGKGGALLALSLTLTLTLTSLAEVHSNAVKIFVEEEDLPESGSGAEGTEGM